MPVSRSAPKPAKKESWLGVVFTAALCGVFLWWWFQPGPVSAETERDPNHWIALARKKLDRAEPTLAMRMEIVMLAEAWRGRGEQTAADRLEAEWLPASWRKVDTPSAVNPQEGTTTPVIGGEASTTAHASPAEFALVTTQLHEAAAAFDALEIERGQDILRNATTTAAGMPEPLRTQALWLVAARQARSGLGTDAANTRAQFHALAERPDFPPWLVDELMEAEIIAPIVDALAAEPPDTPVVVALARRWRALVAQRFTLRESPWLARLGPAADASLPVMDSAPTLWASVEVNQLAAAGGSAKNDPAAHLAIARLLVWLAAPGPSTVESAEQTGDQDNPN